MLNHIFKIMYGKEHKLKQLHHVRIKCQYTFIYNFAKWWPISKIVLLADLAVN